MKKTLAASFGVFALALAGIGGWYWMHERSSTASADQFEAESKDRKLIAVEFEVTAPPETPPDQPLYLSGSEPALGNWDGAGAILRRGEDGKYRGSVEVTSGIEYAYKVTRGTWGTVEKGPKGEELANRSLKCERAEKVPVVVASWVDGGKAVPGRISVAGELREHKKFKSNILNNERTLVVYVPPGYDQARNQRYPVLYMHDGQNLFDEATSYAGIEWKLDEAAQRLIHDGRLKPLIIVGIYNTPDRTPEFTPPPAGRADRYGRFVIEEVKPFIDTTYRTLSDRANTALAGSSMGGLVTLHMAKAHKDKFAQIAVLTPFLRVDVKPLADVMGGDASWLKGMRVWIDMSPSPRKYYPGDDPLGDARSLVKLFDAAGLKPEVDYRFVELSEGEHTEADWQTRGDEVLLFLFGTGASGNPPATSPTASAGETSVR